MFKSAIAIAIVTFVTLVTCNAANAQTTRLGISGDIIEFSNGASTFRVNGVVRGSIAWDMGLQEGDYVLGINGIKPRTQDHIDMAMTAGNGPVVLKVRRGSQIAELTNAVQQSVSPPPSISNFQQLRIRVERKHGSEGDYLQIKRVGEDGLGYQQGLRVGDVIVRMDGKKVTTIREYREIVANATVLHLLVQAPNGSKRRVVIR